jgi:cyclophilin family peptidyl-prolyl cis-trans isomerase
VILLAVFVAGAFLVSLVFGSDDDDDSAVSAGTTAASTETTASESTATTATTVAGGTITGETPCPPVDGSAERVTQFEQAPPMCIDPAKTYTAEVKTNFGDFTIELDPERAPNTVNNFVVLSRYHYYDGVSCHRVVPDFVIQCGDPDGTGAGGPGYTFDDELPEAGEYVLGSLAMANAGPNTNGSQFFVISGSNGTQLPPDYALFGQVTDGLDTTIPAIAALGQPDETPSEPVQIESVTITES